MSKRPKLLLALAWIIGAAVMSIPVQIMAIYGHGPDEILEVFDKMTGLNWMVLLSGIGAATCIAKASPWTRFVVPSFLLIAGVNNYFVGDFATDYSPMQANLATLGLVALNLPLLQPRIFQLLVHPDRRWWMVSKRQRVSVPVFIGGARNAALRAETFDISETGAFIPLATAQDHKYAIGKKGNLEIDEIITIAMTLGTLKQVRCEGRVVRMADARGSYPAGIGIQFMEMGTDEKRELKRYLDRMQDAH